MSHRPVPPATSFTLDAHELHAALWAVSMARSVLRRAASEGRMEDGEDGILPAELEACLHEGVLMDADRQAVLSALHFAAGLYEPGMEEIRQVLQPPDGRVIASSMAKIAAGIEDKHSDHRS